MKVITRKRHLKMDEKKKNSPFFFFFYNFSGLLIPQTLLSLNHEHWSHYSKQNIYNQSFYLCRNTILFKHFGLFFFSFLSLRSVSLSNTPQVSTIDVLRYEKYCFKAIPENLLPITRIQRKVINTKTSKNIAQVLRSNILFKCENTFFFKHI